MGHYTTAQAFGSLVFGRYNVVAGTTTGWITSDPLLVAGNGSSTVAPSNALTLYKDGNLTIAGTLTESSDARLKTGIEPLGPALEGILVLRPVRFRFRDGTGHPSDPQIGLLAQDVAAVFPELVSTDAEGYLSLAYPKLTAVLVRAVQEQQAMIAAQEARLRQRDAALEALQQQVDRLTSRLERLETEPERP